MGKCGQRSDDDCTRGDHEALEAAIVVKKDLAGGCINRTVGQCHLPVSQSVNLHCPILSEKNRRLSGVYTMLNIYILGWGLNLYYWTPGGI